MSKSDVVSPTFTRKMKDAIKFSGEAAKSVWKASTKTVSGVFTKDKDSDDTSSPLGPEPQAEPQAEAEGEEPVVSIPELGECSASEQECSASGSLPDEDLRNAEMDEEQRSQFDKENKDSEFDNDDDGGDFELAIVDEHSESVLNELYDTVSSGVSTVYKIAKENIYDNGAKLIRNFSENVRHIVREELYSFLQTISSSLGDSLLTPGEITVTAFGVQWCM